MLMSVQVPTEAFLLRYPVSKGRVPESQRPMEEEEVGHTVNLTGMRTHAHSHALHTPKFYLLAEPGCGRSGPQHVRWPKCRGPGSDG